MAVYDDGFVIENGYIIKHQQKFIDNQYEIKDCTSPVDRNDFSLKINRPPTKFTHVVQIFQFSCRIKLGETLMIFRVFDN